MINERLSSHSLEIPKALINFWKHQILKENQGQTLDKFEINSKRNLKIPLLELKENQ